MIKIKLYNFNKKPNSTKMPQSYEGTTFNCAIKNISSVIAPVVDIAVGPTNIVNYNYAYIEEFDRYYFINDIVYDQGLWSLSLSCDLLATYKEDIIESEQYIIRSTNKYDPDIVDTMYLTTNMNVYSRSASVNYAGINMDTPYPEPYGIKYDYIAGGGSLTGGEDPTYFNATLSTGSYVVGIIGNNATGVDYYVFTYAGFKEFIRQAFSITPSNMTDVSSGVAQALYNPLQYITMCKWYPSVPSKTGDNLTSLNVGPYRVPQTGSLSSGPRVLDINKVAQFYMNIDIPRHPDAADYPYLNLSPFSEYNLYFQPFGNIPIDSSKIADLEKLTVTWTIDFATGLSNLIIRQNSVRTGDDAIIFNTTADYGVDIPISSLVTDFKTGAIMSGLTWLKDRVEVANALVSGEQQAQNSVMQHTQYANAINAGIDIGKPMSVPAPINTTTIDKVMDALASYKGQLHTVGSSGSFLAYVGVPFIYAYFFDQAEKDPDRYGRPYYQKNYLYAIRGYCLCSNAYINFTDKNPTASEYVEIINMLNNGIYIEV